MAIAAGGLADRAGADILRFPHCYVLLTVPDDFGVWKIDDEFEFFHAEHRGARFLLMRRADPLRALHELPDRLIPFDLEVRAEEAATYGGIEGTSLRLAPKTEGGPRPGKGMVVFHALHNGAFIVFVGRWTTPEEQSVIREVLVSLTPSGSEPLGITPQAFLERWKIRLEERKLRKHAESLFPTLLRKAAEESADDPASLPDRFRALLDTRAFGMEVFGAPVEAGIRGYAAAIVEAAAACRRHRAEAGVIRKELEANRKRIEETNRKMDRLREEEAGDRRAMAMEFLREELAAATTKRGELRARQKKHRDESMRAAEERWDELVRSLLAGERPPNLPPLPQTGADGTGGAREKSLLRFLKP